MKIQKFEEPFSGLPFGIDELAKMNPFRTLWECSKERLNQVAMTYTADLNYDDLNKQPIRRYITYKDLINNILKVYHSLKKMGVTPDDVITYYSASTPELVYTVYACTLLGCKFKSIDARYSSQEIYEQLSMTPSKLFFGSDLNLDKIKPISESLKCNHLVDKIILTSYNESLPMLLKIGANINDRIKFDKKLALDRRLSMKWHNFINFCDGHEMPKNIDQVDIGEIIQITSTTGSSGKAKDIYRTGGNWACALANVSSSGLVFEPGDKFLNCTVPWVDFGLMQSIHPFLCHGVRIDFDPLWLPEKNAMYILKNNPQWWMGAPSWLDDLFTNSKYNDLIKNHGKFLLSNAKYFITGGAALFPHKFIEYNNKLSTMSLKGRVTPGYGYTEANCALTVNLSDDPENLGRIFPLYDVKILNPETMEPVKLNEVGELYSTGIRNDALTPISPGYHNNPQAQKEIFVKFDNDDRVWAKSGDKVKLVKPKDTTNSDDVAIQFVDRYKNTLTCEGYNIDCSSIQSEISTLKPVGNVVVFGCITKDGNQKPVVCVEKSLEYKNFNDDDLVNMIYILINERKPSYYEPGGVAIFDTFPKIGIKTDIQLIKKMCLDENGCFKSENSNQVEKKKIHMIFK